MRTLPCGHAGRLGLPQPLSAGKLLHSERPEIATTTTTAFLLFDPTEIVIGEELAARAPRASAWNLVNLEPCFQVAAQYWSPHDPPWSSATTWSDALPDDEYPADSANSR